METDEKQLNNEKDFHWFKAEQDVKFRTTHMHVGVPDEFPCKVTTNFDCTSNGSEIAYHDFRYKKKIECEKCGHCSCDW